MSRKLTTAVIKQVRPAQKRVVIYDSVITGLHVIVTPKGKKTLNLWYRTRKRRAATMKLGDWPTITLHQAREMARQLLAEIALGGDPARKRALDRRAATVTVPTR